MANPATAKKGEEFKSDNFNTREKVLFRRIDEQRKIATGEKQREEATGQAQRDVLTGKSNIIDFLKYREEKRKKTSEAASRDKQGKEKSDQLYSELEQVSQKKTEELGGNEALAEKLAEKLVEKVVDDSKTEEEYISEIKSVISENTEISDLSAEVEAKITVLEVEKIEENHPDEVREVRGKNLAEKIGNKDLGEVTEEVLYGSEGYKKSDLVLINNNQKNPQLEVQVVTGLLSKTPDEVKRIKDKYKKAKDKLNNELPLREVPQLAALDRVLNSLEDEKIGQTFNLVHRGGWMQKIRSVGEKQSRNSIVETTDGFITKVGKQSSKDFVQNSIGILASGGFYGGFKNILSGILNGGVRVLGGVGGGLTKTLGMAAGASNPAGWMAMGGKALLRKIFGGLKSLGLDLLNKGKNGLGSGGSKALGWLMGGLGAVGSIGGLIAAMAPQVIVVILVSVLGVSFLTMNYTQNQSPTVPPTVNEPETNSVNDPSVDPGSEGVIGGSCARGTLSISNIYEPINMDNVKKRVKASEYKYKSNGNIDFACINGLLPQKGTRQRSDIIKVAYALLGVPYFMTGGHGTIADGVSSRWGNKITPTSQYGNNGRKYLGLDCSGFVRWVYKYVTGEVVGNRARDIYSKSQKINKSELIPGDIGFISGDHIGIFFGKGTDGKYYFIHSAGRSSHVGPQGLGGVWISPYNFKQFGRIKVNLN